MAFACGDVFLAAHSLHDRGLPLLSISGTYYEDLAAQTDLERRPRYDGYGAANSPTRIAAERELATAAAGA